MRLLAVTWLLSLALHILCAAALLSPGGHGSIDSGHGSDRFTVEKGFAIEGLVKLGNAAKSSEPVQTPPAELSAAQPEIEMLRAQPVVEPAPVVSSPQGPVQDRQPNDLPKPIETLSPQQTAAMAQIETLPVRELQSSSDDLQAERASEKSKYLGQLRRHLEHHKVRPSFRAAGTVVVQFSVNAQGSLLSHHVTKTSGSKKLDQTALTAIERAAPFPPVPETVGETTIVVSIPFKFAVR